MKPEITTCCSVEALYQELAGCRLTNSRYYPNFSLEGLRAETNSCRIIKDSVRRQVFYLQTPTGGYFLKRSTLVRRKDRRRHFLLPFRKWSEWRNLHRLLRAGIETAKPVMKGESKDFDLKMFFLLTGKVDGLPLRIDSAAEAAQLGEYLAMLHSRGVYHADLHPHNIILKPEGNQCLIDVQEVFFLPWMPRHLRVNNLGKIHFNLASADDWLKWTAEFLEGYNQVMSDNITFAELNQAAGHHQRRKYRSRSRRCCKNSTEFVIVKAHDLIGFKRRDFSWGTKELQQALSNGQSLKGAHVISYQGVCIKKHRIKLFHQNRCLTSWKMSRALEVRGIAVPRPLGYFVIKGHGYFLTELLENKLHLNAYLAALSDERIKRMALKKLAVWLRTFHDNDVWQRDFKSSNILCRNSNFFMVDLDGVRIRRLSEQNKIYNLAQLNASISNAISIKDRLRFYHYYSADFQPTRQQRRAVYRKVSDITKSKNTKIYDLDYAKLLESQVRAGPNK